MLYLKFSFLTISLFFSLSAFAFKDNECLSTSFEVEVKHKGFPFGMTENILRISKKNCTLEISHEKLKFIKNVWLVDVCRAPVHIKRAKVPFLYLNVMDHV